MKEEMNEFSELAEKECIPCKGGVSPLKGDDLTHLLVKVGSDWKIINEHHLEREFLFDNFREALVFTNRVAALAEEQNHHPDISLSFGRVVLSIWTHKIDGLTESDFIFAAKVGTLINPYPITQ